MSHASDNVIHLQFMGDVYQKNSKLTIKKRKQRKKSKENKKNQKSNKRKKRKKEMKSNNFDTFRSESKFSFSKSK